MPFDLRHLVETVAQFTGQLGQESSAGRGAIWQKTQGFAVKLLTAATERWVPFYMLGHRCHVQRVSPSGRHGCDSNGILLCDCCGRPACIDHAQVDSTGHGTCAVCIGELIRMKRGEAPPPPGAGPSQQAVDDLIDGAFKVLGLKRGASWIEINAAHRKKAAAAHPDLVKTSSAKQRATEKSAEINAAHATLKKHYTVQGVA